MRIIKPSRVYYDTSVIVNGVSYNIGNDSYGLQLICTRAGGWSLWHNWAGKEEKVGGEFNYDAFEIRMNGALIFQNDEAKKQAKLSGKKLLKRRAKLKRKRDKA